MWSCTTLLAIVFQFLSSYYDVPITQNSEIILFHTLPSTLPHVRNKCSYIITAAKMSILTCRNQKQYRNKAISSEYIKKFLYNLRFRIFIVFIRLTRHEFILWTQRFVLSYWWWQSDPSHLTLFWLSLCIKWSSLLYLYILNLYMDTLYHLQCYSLSIHRQIYLMLCIYVCNIHCDVITHPTSGLFSINIHNLLT